MATPTMWRGHLQVSLLTIGVRTHAAVESERGIRFKRVHATCGTPVKQTHFCPTCETSVDKMDLGKAAVMAGGDLRQVDENEVKACSPAATRVMKLETFVPSSRLDPMRFVRPYRLAPDGKVHRESYAVFRAALGKRAALGRLSVGGREHLIAIMAEGKGLIMWHLRRDAEVRAQSDVQDLDALPKPPADAVALAKQVIDGMPSDMSMLSEPDPVEQAREKLVNGLEAPNVVSLTEQLRAALERERKAS